MPTFCNSCGATMTGAFCNKCGVRAAAPGVPLQSVPQPTPVQIQPQVPTPTPSQPAVTPTKSSGAGKILLVIGGVLLMLFVIGVAAAMYGVYWVKHKVSTYTSAVTGSPSEPVKVVGNGNSCRLLSTSELQQVLGVAIEKSAEIMEGSEPGCAYYTNPAAFSQLQRMAADQARRQSEEASKKPGPQGDNPLALLKDANQMEGIVKTLGMTQPDKDGQVFSFSLQRNAGSDAWAGVRVVQAAVPGFEEVQGVGDHAMIGAFGHAFYLQKGDVIIHLNTMWVPDTRTRGAEIGKKIVGNL